MTVSVILVDGVYPPNSILNFITAWHLGGNSEDNLNTGLDLALDALVGMRIINTIQGGRAVCSGNTAANPSIATTVLSGGVKWNTLDAYRVEFDSDPGDLLTIESPVRVVSGVTSFNWYVTDVSAETDSATYVETINNLADLEDGYYDIVPSSLGVITLSPGGARGFLSGAPRDTIQNLIQNLIQ